MLVDRNVTEIMPAVWGSDDDRLSPPSVLGAWLPPRDSIMARREERISAIFKNHPFCQLNWNSASAETLPFPRWYVYRSLFFFFFFLSFFPPFWLSDHFCRWLLAVGSARWLQTTVEAGRSLVHPYFIARCDLVLSAAHLGVHFYSQFKKTTNT